MTVLLFDHKISYFSVPKCACTSLKRFFFVIENGFPFRAYKANGQMKMIHNAAYKSLAFEDVPHARIADHTRVAVVRDPVGRLLSCYTNRVVRYKELSNLDLTEEDKAAGVVNDPDLPTFVRFLDRYRELSFVVRHHSRPLSHFLGQDPAYFSKIFNLSQTQELVDYVKERIEGCELPELQHVHASTSEEKKVDFSPEDMRAVQEYYAEDYSLYGEFFAH